MNKRKNNIPNAQKSNSFQFSQIIMFILNYFRRKRTKERKLSLISKFIKPGSMVLDLGAGNGQIAEELHAVTGASFTLLDVIDYNTSKFPLQLFNGKKIPYPDNYFDQSLVIFVLHHLENANEQERILQELIRVTKEEIIIWEDTPRNWFEELINRFVDYVINFEAGVPVTHLYNRHNSWRLLFEFLGLDIVHEIYCRDFGFLLGGYAQQLYVLRKK